MKSDQNIASSQRTGHRIAWLLISGAATLFFTGSEAVSLWLIQPDRLWAVLPVVVAIPLAIWLVRRGKQIPATVLLMTAIGLQAVLTTLVQRGAGIPNAFMAITLISGIAFAALPRRYIGRILMGAMVIAIASVLIDLFASPARPMAELSQGRWTSAIVMMVVFGIFVTRELLSLDIRTKIIVGILGTGGLALATLVVFALLQTEQITSSLSERLEVSVSQLAEEQLVNTAFVEADKANGAFELIAEEVGDLAQNWVLLRRRQSTLNLGTYWDAETSLRKLEGGQYGNPKTETSSVFVPVHVTLDDALIADLNLSAYLDFFAPGVLETNPSLLAVYAIDTRGATRYYPNIGLAWVVPPDFDTTKRPYYLITAPLFNPQHTTRWTIPYVDATGGGLVVTAAAPVYDGDEFIGVIAADMQLAQITEQIGDINVGETGYAFLLDDAGRILAMPPAGFDMFGIDPEDLNSEEFFKQTVLMKGTNELQAVTKRMTSGGNGLLIVDVNGVDTYISFAPIEANGYSIALVVPVAELQGAIPAAREQTQRQIRNASQVAGVLLILLLLVAVGVSLGLGQIIARPIQRLTQVASQIAAGELSVQAAYNTDDEIGTLANAFNVMTARLRETLDGLERRVDERTTDLVSANERNERRAQQFEAVAHVARAIASTSDQDTLLPLITSEISRSFGFYHVGIFLLDVSKEYAVLGAANSEGGQLMLAHGHRLRVGETGIVGHVTGTGTPRVALDTGAEAIYFNNPYLPETRSEMALPLRAGGEIIGALDVQSTQANAFSQEDISILSTLAEQVSIAIQNAQQFQQTRKALSEAEALAKQFVRAGWQQFTRDKNLTGLHRKGTRSTFIYGKNGGEHEEERWPKEQGRQKSRGAALALPIKLRGEVIGSVNIHSPDSRPWDQDELDVVRAIIERVAIAMENARLLEESQRLASKEAKIGEVTARISSSINMRNVLQVAVAELGRALPGSEVVIQFQTDQNKNKTTL